MHLTKLMIRYPLMMVLLVAAVAVPSRLVRSEPGHGSVPDPEIPEAVERAALQGRYWRASRILGEYLAAMPDTAPETILLASKLSAGWGDWRSVAALLEGRSWLDRLEDGTGWRLLGRSRIALGAPGEGSEALGRYLRLASPGQQEAGITEIRRGTALASAGRVDEALAAYDRAAAHLPELADWVHLFAAEAAARAGDTAEVRARLAASEPELVEDRGWRLRTTAAARAGDNDGARRAALSAARAAGSAARRAAAWTVLADLRMEGGDSALAREAYRSAMEAASGSTAAVDAARGLSGLAPSPDEWRSIAAIYLRHGNQTRAIEGFERFLESGAGSPAERAQARLQLGQALFDAGRYRDAERRLLQLADDAVPERIAADALYLAGRAQYRQGRGDEGQATFVRLADRFPGQDATTRGLYLLADLKHDALEIDAARTYYRRAASAQPDLNEAGLALMRLAGLEFLDRNYEAAARLYEEYRTKHPSGRRILQSTYWAGRAYAELGRDAEAAERFHAVRRLDPLSYYGMRAAELLDTPLLPALEPSPARDAMVDSLVRAGLRRVDLLAELERRDDVVYEVERLRRHFEGRDGGEYALAEALNERGYTLTAVGMGWDIRRREGAWNDRLLRIIYPFPFQSLVLPEAEERGLDPYLVAGVIRRESAFNPTVSSSAGAIGLMQIMPETGRGLARGAGLRNYHPELLRQPELNVHLGTRYLAQLLDQFDGQLPLVLSAYNAGPHRAVRWREMPEERDMELFAERIPYAETRDYVRHVLLNRALYRALYPDARGEPTESSR